MATTLDRSYRYPGQGIEPDVAGDIQRLAEDVSADVAKLYKNLPIKIAYGQDSIAIGAGSVTATKDITLPAGFASAPLVYLQNMSNVAGRAALLDLYVNDPRTSSAFRVKMQTSDNAAIGTGYTIAFAWVAIGVAS